MATSPNRQSDAASPAGQGIDAQGQVAAASELAERHHRTSKHRAPARTVRPPVRRPSADKPRSKSSSGPSAAQRLRLWMAPDTLSSRLIRTGWVLLAVLAIVIVLYIFYRTVVGSRFFAVRAVIVEENKLLTQAQVESMVRSLAIEGTLGADLGQIQARVQREDMVKEVRVTRMLPDTLKVVVKEREPYALARRNDGSVVCVDAEGVMFGRAELFKPKVMLPLISGLAESGTQAGEVNRRYLAAYQKLLEEINRTPPLSVHIDEVVFNDVHGMSVILEDPRVAVLLGKEDFRPRLNAALDVLEAVSKGNAEALNVLRISDAEKLVSGARISYLNATIPERIVVGLDE
ncbi:MAG TPA: FtsQ-type POTRA domain-containing protein [Blastocatellia bacterium]|nr:FtsQ-type POTRA domain-containing protein [Blastocatellia bacterium]